MITERRSRIIRNVFILLAVCLATFSQVVLNAQVINPVKWALDIAPLSGDEYVITYKATMDKGWAVYSQESNDEGPVPTEITYEGMDGAELIGNGVESGARKEGYEKLFEVNVIKYLDKEPFIISQKVKVTDPTKPITGYLTYMTCNDKTCLPPTDVDFNFKIPTSNVVTSTSGKEEKVTESTTPETTEKDKPASTIKIGGLKMKDQSNNEGESIGEQNDSSSGLLEPVKWTVTKNVIDGGTEELVFKADIEDGWTVYSQFTSDDGPVPTSINFEAQDGIELIGDAEEQGYKKEGPDPLFDNVNVIKYTAKEPFIIKQKIKVNDPSKELKGYLTYMTCNNKTCLPPTDVDFSFFGSGNSTTQIITSGDKFDQTRPNIKATVTSPLSDCGQGDAEESESLWWLFLAGMLGGFAALMTPCVFPMIPITVSFFTKDTKRKGWMNGLIYGLSIIAIYVTLGLLITITAGPDALNALSTNWIANVIFFLIFIAFAFSFFGYYELTLPSSWTTKTDSMADKGGLLGIFFMAATLSLVSFSCTGPIVGSALVAAANGGYVGPAIVMLGFSLALALPFGLFAAFPAWLNSLPKSGGWMNSVKVVLGFLEIGFAFKFLSTADLTQHWGILPYEVFMGIMILVCLAIAIYLFGFIKFPHDSKHAKISLPRKGLATVFGLLAIYLATGFTINDKTGIYNSLWLTSGFSPPVNYNLFLEKGEVDPNIKAKYPSFTKCANNIDCFKNYFEGLDYAKEQNKPIFIDFTGHGCQNCRRVEDQYWVQDEVRRLLNDEVVLISLYVDDRKKLDSMLISQRDDYKMRNVGNQWTDFQIVNFDRNAQPWYTMATTDEKIITHPQGFDYFNQRGGASTYEDYLKCGLEAWNGMK